MLKVEMNIGIQVTLFPNLEVIFGNSYIARTTLMGIPFVSTLYINKRYLDKETFFYSLLSLIPIAPAPTYFAYLFSSVFLLVD